MSSVINEAESFESAAVAAAWEQIAHPHLKLLGSAADDAKLGLSGLERHQKQPARLRRA